MCKRVFSRKDDHLLRMLSPGVSHRPLRVYRSWVAATDRWSPGPRILVHQPKRAAQAESLLKLGQSISKHSTVYWLLTGLARSAERQFTRRSCTCRVRKNAKLGVKRLFVLRNKPSYGIRTYTPDAGDHGEHFWSGFGWDDSHHYAHTEAKYTTIMPVLFLPLFPIKNSPRIIL